MKVNHPGERYNMRWGGVLFTALCLIVMLLTGCKHGEQPPEEEETVLTVSSSAFQVKDKIPSKYSCQGEDVSPPLAWSEPPGGTQSLVLILEDSDAPGGVFTHWVLFNIPSDSRELPEAVPTQAQLPGGALQGKNDFGGIGYRGPCPPPGRAHRYRFTLYALDHSLDLEAGVSEKELLAVMRGHVLTQGQLTGTYQR